MLVSPHCRRNSSDPDVLEDIRAAIEELIDCRFLMRIGSCLAVLARAHRNPGPCRCYAPSGARAHAPEVR